MNAVRRYFQLHSLQRLIRIRGRFIALIDYLFVNNDNELVRPTCTHYHHHVTHANFDLSLVSDTSCLNIAYK